ncbi:MAG TPA: imidazole glycerol phosphate synthase subunit HisH [Anaerolineaceae bacterium]|nr:imidazole glycerol phosphate synthase subunit HisH [Anaerolineaceae bacterium]
MEDALLIDAGTGNLHSVYNALASLGYKITVTSDPVDLAHGGRLILPGVGAFGKFMEGLNIRNLCEPVKSAVSRGDPVLGICVGMQALFEYSEEMGKFSGLGILPGKVARFPDRHDLKVPQTGWNQLWPCSASPLLNEIKPGSYAYFNHSYYCEPASNNYVAALTDYGFWFASVLQYQALFAVQFHPEKSQRIGRQILKNFMELKA